MTESTAQSPGEAKSATEDVKEEEQQQQQKKNEVEGKSIEPAATGDGKGTADEGLSSIFQSPLRLVRRNKMKLVVCHVALLDGTDFPCEVEVRQRTRLCAYTHAGTHARARRSTHAEAHARARAQKHTRRSTRTRAHTRTHRLTQACRYKQRRRQKRDGVCYTK